MVANLTNFMIGRGDSLNSYKLIGYWLISQSLFEQAQTEASVVPNVIGVYRYRFYLKHR